MGVLQRFEHRLEDMVGGTFARIFKGRVEPVEIAKALQREADERRAVFGAGQVMVPNRYTVGLGRSDYERLVPWDVQLTRSLAEMVQEFIDDEGWSTYGDVVVQFVYEDGLRTGIFRVSSAVDADAPPRRRPHDSLSIPVVHDEIASSYNPPAPSYPQAHQPAAPSGPPPQDGQRDYGRAAPTGPVLLVDGTERSMPVPVGTTVIGRAHEADLRLPDTGVSRRHASVRYDGRVATLEDIGSTNGTFVNGHRIQVLELQHGDVIRIGHTVVVFEVASSQRSASGNAAQGPAR
ncbi:MAG: FhaA domain-containing protein [Mycobacteriales bacterium]